MNKPEFDPTPARGDAVDIAQSEQAIYNALALARRAPEGPPETGACLFCHAALDSGRWCDADCRDDWQKRNPLPAQSPIVGGTVADVLPERYPGEFQLARESCDPENAPDPANAKRRGTVGKRDDV